MNLSCPGYSESIDSFVGRRIAALDKLRDRESDLLALCDRMIECLESGGTIWTTGNGGGQALAQHMAAELVGKMSWPREPYAAVAIGADACSTTCIANDYGFDHIFSHPLRALCREKDLVILFSFSGYSSNVSRADSIGRDHGLDSVLIEGGFAHPASRTVLCLDCNDAAEYQDVASVVMHFLCKVTEDTIEGRKEDRFWEEVVARGRCGMADTLLLDRDGVINVRPLKKRYVTSLREFVILPGILRHAAALAEAFRHIAVVTNQRGVGVGEMSAGALGEIHAVMREKICAAGGRIDRVEVASAADRADHMRKPGTGMAEALRKAWPDMDFRRTVMVGDTYVDEKFAENIGAMFMRKEGWCV